MLLLLFLDLSVGAYKTGEVVLLRSYPVVEIVVDIEPRPQSIVANKDKPFILLITIQMVAKHEININSTGNKLTDAGRWQGRPATKTMSGLQGCCRCQLQSHSLLQTCR